MNSLHWIAQILLAGVFLFTGAGKLFAYEKVVKVMEARSRNLRLGMTRGQAALAGVAEVVGALGLLVPGRLDPSHLIVLFSAAWLALLMVGAGVYHLWRHESAAPSIVLFLLALFILVGRWPH